MDTIRLNCEIAQLAYKTPSGDPIEIFSDLSMNIHKVFFLSTVNDAQLYTILNDESIIFAIRGTESLCDVKTDINFFKDPFHDIIYSNNIDAKKYKNIRVHQGFLKQFNSIKYSIISTIYGQLWKHNKNITKVTCIGHSLGGGLATLAAAHIKSLFPSEFKVECYTYGSPRVGNKKFRMFFNDKIDVSVRCVNGCDIITKIPKINYYHIKGEYRIGNKDQNIFRKIFGNVKDHLIANYLNSLETVKSTL
jgi:predicted lipase